MPSKLMQLAIDQIEADLKVGDVAPLQVLLQKLDKDDLYYFLSEENQALANHFEYEYDGQPDEAQEWHDFDPDC
jgi:hypothetical protein